MESFSLFYFMVRFHIIKSDDFFLFFFNSVFMFFKTYAHTFSYHSQAGDYSHYICDEFL